MGGDDTHARTVEIWTGPGKRRTFKRDVTKIVPLELDGGETKEEIKTEEMNRRENEKNEREETERQEERATKDGPMDRQGEAEPKRESPTATGTKEKPRSDGDTEIKATTTHTQERWKYGRDQEKGEHSRET